MGKQIRKGRTFTTRATFPVSGLMSGDSFRALSDLSAEMQEKKNKNAAAIRRVHS